MFRPETAAGQVPASGRPLYLSITGLDNALEASQLIRLFHEGELILLPVQSTDTQSTDTWSAVAQTTNTQTTDTQSTDTWSAVAQTTDTQTTDTWPNDTLTTFPTGENDLTPHAWHVRLEAREEGGWFRTRTIVCRDGIHAGLGELGFETGGKPAATDMFLQSRKLCAGTALYGALEQAFGLSLPWGSLTGVRPVKLASCCMDAGMGEEEALRTLQSRTGMQADKARLIWEVAGRERPFLSPPERSVSLYVGIPFCASRCLYCSFTSYPVARHGSLIPEYLAAMGKEIRFVGSWLRLTGTRLSSVYIGGGTPTALPLEHLGPLLDLMAACLPMETSLEYTVEAGRPDTVDPAKLQRIKSAGVTRISINPQSMQGETLRRIGRGHSPEDVEEAFAMARSAGFDNINADLIAGLSGETEEDFRNTLERMAPLRPDSLTVHTLAVKRASRLHETMVAGTAAIASTDAQVQEMIADASVFARQHGLLPYYLYRQKNILANLENTGYARPGCECRYNVETMSERQTVIAVGSGGITKVSFGGGQLERTFNVRELGNYIGRIDEMIARKEELLARRYRT